MAVVTLPPPRKGIENSLTVIERILRDHEGIWEQVLVEHRLNELIVQLITSSTVALACYGLVIGFSIRHPEQAISSAIKLPILFLLTLLICLPTLYLFNLVFGARMSVRQAMALVLVGITVTAMLTLAFTPISLLFLISGQSTPFFKLLNVAILSLTGTFGLSFLIGGMRSLNKLALLAQAQNLDDEPGQRPRRVEQLVNTPLLYMWVLLYGFVGAQLGWTLRPFFGSNRDFEIFRSLDSLGGKLYFYENIRDNIVRLFS